MSATAATAATATSAVNWRPQKKRRSDSPLRRQKWDQNPSGTSAIGNAIHLATQRFMDGEATLRAVLDALDALLDAEGLDVLDPFHRPGRHPGDLARPRRFEIAAAINRLRSLRMRQHGPEA